MDCYWENLSNCDIYNRLLPLWEFRDKWEPRTKLGQKYEIHKKMGDEYFGVIYFGPSWRSGCWDGNGKSELVNDCLVPKKIVRSEFAFNSFQDLVDAVAEKLKK